MFASSSRPRRHPESTGERKHRGDSDKEGRGIVSLRETQTSGVYAIATRGRFETPERANRDYSSSKQNLEMKKNG
jgi:hypothetical protein